MFPPNMLFQIVFPYVPLFSPALSLNIPSSPSLFLSPQSRPNNTHYVLEWPPPQCRRISTTIGLAPTHCESLAMTLCTRISLIPDAEITFNRWNWTELPGCAIGYYLPPGGQRAFRPDCVHMLGEMVEQCGFDSEFNAGAINVRRWPTFQNSGSSVHWMEGRYIMAPERLTL